MPTRADGEGRVKFFDGAEDGRDLGRGSGRNVAGGETQLLRLCEPEGKLEVVVRGSIGGEGGERRVHLGNASALVVKN